MAMHAMPSRCDLQVLTYGNSRLRQTRTLTISTTISWSRQSIRSGASNGVPRRFRKGEGVSDYLIFDSWQDLPADKPFYSSAFLDGILKRDNRAAQIPSLPGTLNIRIAAPLIAPDEVLAVSGEGEYLGDWDPAKAIVLSDHNYPVWEVNLDLAKLKVPFEYKFLIKKKDSNEVVGWEAMNNRIYGVRVKDANAQVVIDGIRFANPKRPWKGAYGDSGVLDTH